MNKNTRLSALVALAACLAMTAPLAAVPQDEARALSWSQNALVNEPFDAQHINARIAVGPDGRMHTVWVDYRNGASDPDIYYSVSGDNGTSFLHPNLEASTDMLTDYTQGSPDVAVTGSGTAVVAWSEFQGLDTNIRAARLSQGTEVFTPLGIINHITNGAQETPSISASGSRLALAWKDGRSNNLVNVWSASNGSLVRSMSGHSASVTSVDYSPDGAKLASGSEDGLVKVWNPANGALLANLTGHADVVTCVAWSPDGTRLASGSWDYTVKIWSSATYALIDTLTNSNNPVNSLDWSPDSKYLVVGHNGEGVYSSQTPGFPNTRFNVTLWNVTAKTSSLLGEHANTIKSVRYSADGAHVASASGAESDSSFDNSVKIWSVGAPLTPVRTIASAGGYVNSVSWNQTGALAAALENGTVAVYWSPVHNETAMGYLDTGDGAAKSTDWLPASATLAAGCSDGRASAWNVTTASRSSVTARGANTVHGVSLSPNGLFLATGSGNSKLYRRSESHVYCAVSNDDGQTWPLQSRVDSVGAFELGSPSVSVGANGDVGVAWYDARGDGVPKIYYANSTDGGATFSPDVLSSTGVGKKYSPSVALDSQGVAYLAWHDERDKTATERYDVYFARSDDLTTNLRVSPSAPYIQQQSADVVVSANGSQVAICWSENGTHIKVGVSNDGGASFDPPDDVSDSALGTRWLPSVCMKGGDLHIVWHDYRRSYSNVYFSSTVLTDTWPPTVLSVYPTAGASNVSTSSPAIVAFTEPVNQGSFFSAISVVGDGTTWTGANLSLAWSDYGDRVTIAPPNGFFAPYTTYTLTISSSVMDLSGNPMSAQYAWSFTTGSDIDGPSIEIVSAPSTVEYDDTAMITASIRDYSGVAEAWLHYRLNGTANFTGIQMMENSAQYYEGAIPAQMTLGVLQYYVWANDTLGNNRTLPGNLSAGQYLEVSVVDLTAPEVSTVGISSIEFDSPTAVNATVAEALGTPVVSIEYNMVNGYTTYVASMAHVFGSNYTGTIPAQNDVGNFSYRIVATDSSNNTGSSAYFTVRAVDSAAPTLSVPTAKQGSDGRIVITVTASDNHQLSQVTLHYMHVGSTRYLPALQMLDRGNGTYSVTIEQQQHSGIFKYYINATDASQNVASTLDMNSGKPYSIDVSGKLPSMSVILVISIIVIVAGLLAIAYLLRRKRARVEPDVKGAPEHPLESVNVQERVAPEPPKRGGDRPEGD